MKTPILIIILSLSTAILGQGLNNQLQFGTSINSNYGNSTSNHQQFNTGNNKYKSALQPQNNTSNNNNIHGVPDYKAGATAKENQELNEVYTKEHLSQQKGYYTPNAENNFNQLSPAQREMYMLQTVFNEVATMDARLEAVDYYNTPKFKNDFPNYLNAKNYLVDMLLGKRKLSLKDAYYQIEAAFGNLHLTYKEYSDIIDKSAAFIKEWLAQNGYDIKDQDALHLGIQKFMGDQLTLKNNPLDKGTGFLSTRTHKPFYYDFQDYRAIEDKRNYFLTKALATGTGQCNNLPAVYLVLAEALGAETYLCYAPQHSFVTYKNNKGVFQNYEPTIDWHMTNQDYAKELPIMATALQKGLYLDPLNKKEIVASLLVDLASNFEREHRWGDGSFINDCINTATQYFKDKDGGNAEIHYLRSLLLASKLGKTMRTENINDLSQINQSPKAQKAYADYRKNEQKITELGLQGFPEVKYQEMLQRHDKKGKLQASKKINAKSKKNLFINY